MGVIEAGFLTERCPRYAVEREPRIPPPEPRPPFHPCATRCSTCSPRRRCARGCSSRAATTSSCSRAPSAGRVSTPRCCGCVPPGAGLAVTLDGQGRLGSLDPRVGGAARDPRGGAQRRLRRRRAARLHRLPQLRQPGEGGDRLGARRGDRGDGARVRGARRPGRLRQRLALQRHRRALDPPDAGRRLCRARAGRAPRPGRLERGRRDSSRALALAAHARRLGGAGAMGHARRYPRRSTSSPRRRSSATRRAPRSTPRSSTTSRRAGSRSRSPRRPSGAAVGRSSSSTRTR